MVEPLEEWFPGKKKKIIYIYLHSCNHFSVAQLIKEMWMKLSLLSYKLQGSSVGWERHSQPTAETYMTLLLHSLSYVLFQQF